MKNTGGGRAEEEGWRRRRKKKDAILNSYMKVKFSLCLII
jgi:hypothetical protein